MFHRTGHAATGSSLRSHLRWLRRKPPPILWTDLQTCSCAFRGGRGRSRDSSRHRLNGKPAFESPAHQQAIQLAHMTHRRHCLLRVSNGEARHAILDNLRHRAEAECDHRCPAGHRLDHHKPEGFRPVDRKQPSLVNPPCTNGRMPLHAWHARRVGLLVVQAAWSEERTDCLLYVVRDREAVEGEMRPLRKPHLPFRRLESLSGYSRST